MQEQWKKKKQTKEEAAAARRAKLDPSVVKSAKDIMDERAKKRKLDLLQEEGSDIEGVERERPKQGLKKAADNKAKKQKTQEKADKSKAPVDDAEAAKQAKLEAKKLKIQKTKEKAAKKAEAKKAKKAKVADSKIDIAMDDAETNDEGIVVEKAEIAVETVEDVDDDEEAATAGDDMMDIEMDGISDEEEEEEEAEKSNEPEDASNAPTPTFDTTDKTSANTSTSSTIPPSKPNHIKLPTIDPEILKARLAARIETLRAARKADGPNGAPARNRQELMDARRKKEDARRAHKKELRAAARQEEDARREEALSSVRESPASAMMSPAIADNNNFSFGRVAFADGQHLAPDLSALLAAPKKKGPQDAATAPKAAENRRLRISGLDEGKRADIEEKDVWLNAKKRVHGEKVRDDAGLLKKTLKRREASKKKSEKEWGERKEGVAKGQAIRQKKRTENLQKRKDMKGVKGKKGGKPKSKPKARPGFEGSFGGGKGKGKK